MRWVHLVAVSPGGKIYGNSVIRLMMWPFRSCSGSLAAISYFARLREERDWGEVEQVLTSVGHLF